MKPAPPEICTGTGTCRVGDGKVQFEVTITHDTGRFSATGQDTVEFLISVNPGQAPKPLGKVASGREISRIMLSIKSIFGGLDAIETMVFDEIDTGISGRTAQVVAEKIQALTVTPPGGDRSSALRICLRLPRWPISISWLKSGPGKIPWKCVLSHSTRRGKKGTFAHVTARL